MSVTVRKPKAIILDIEGTICNPNFIRDKLTPLFKLKVEDYLDDNYERPEAVDWINRLRFAMASSDVHIPDWSSPREEIISTIVSTFQKPIQNPSQKLLHRELNILMWVWFYRRKMAMSRVYDEVSTILHDWKFEQDIQYICLFSSSSPIPQKLMICHTNCGNLVPLIDHFVGPKFGLKHQRQSYRNIADGLSLPVGDLMFITDDVREANAASGAGCLAVLIFRDGNDIPHKDEPNDKVKKISSLEDLKFIDKK